MKPTISIIVPVHNVDPHLKKCLDSILSQTLTNFELIVVNDGSKDQSGEICDAYAKADQRVKVIHQDYGGVSSARNVGVNYAQGEYIGFVDSDDYIKERMFQTLYEVSQKTDSDIAICKLGRQIDGELMNDSLEDRFVKELSNEEAMRELFKGNLYRFSLCNKLFKKTCFENIFFPEGRIHEDLATTYKLFANSKKAVYVNYMGYIYVKQKNSILTSQFYEARLDAFVGWDEILTFMRINYPQLSDEYVSTFTYGCIDNIHSVMNQVDINCKRKSYLKAIQRYIRKYYRNILQNKGLSLKSKTLAMVVGVNVSLFIFAHKAKQKRFI